MPSRNKQIEKTVTENWAAFEAMSWASPSGAIRHYISNPEQWEMDMVAVRSQIEKLTMAKGRAQRGSDSAKSTDETIQRMRYMFDVLGYTVEEIMEQEPCWIDDGTDNPQWAHESVYRIVHRIPSRMQQFLSQMK